MIRVVTDTTSSLTLEQYKNYDIKGVPLYVRQNDNSRKELFEISYEEFYREQRKGLKFTTSQPDPNSFLEVFRPIIEAGDEIICITLSSKISGTINSANLARQMLETEQISLVDSFQSGYGQSSLAIKAKELADQGINRPEIVAYLENMREQIKVYFIVQSLRYLYEGGRLNGAEALIGSIIQIKPIIWFEQTGLMTALEKVRTLKAAKQRTMELLQEQAKSGIEKIALHYGDNFDEAVEYAKIMEDTFNVSVPLIKLSPVIACHTGPDILGPCIITKC